MSEVKEVGIAQGRDEGVMEAKVAPLPWRVDTRPSPCSECKRWDVTETAVIAANGDEVTLTSPHDAFGPVPVDAAFIVRAANSHDALVSALQAMLGDYEDQRGVDACECDSSVGLTCNPCRARAAIALAKGGQG